MYERFVWLDFSILYLFPQHQTEALVVSEERSHSAMLHSIAADSVRKMIVEGGLQPGEPLPSEGSLAEQLGMGRTSIREALKLLTAEGFVEVRRGSGVYVGSPRLAPTLEQLNWFARVDADAYRDINEMRLILEVGIAPLVIERAQPTHLDAMSQAIWEARREFDRGTLDLRRYDYTFHQAYLEASDNSLAISFGERLRQFFQNEEYAKLVDRTPEQVRRVLAEHAQILESILLGDLDRLRRVLVTHLERRKQVSPLLRDSLRGRYGPECDTPAEGEHEQ